MAPDERTAGGDAAVVLAFNDAINRRDLAALTTLMTPGHRFVDPSGASLAGQDACAEAWRGFFESFPDYRNIFDEIVDHGGGRVVASGRSECRVRELDGPAEWHADVIDGRVDVWHVTEPDRGPAGSRDSTGGGAGGSDGGGSGAGERDGRRAP